MKPTYDELHDALDALVHELEEWDVPQTDEEGEFGPDTALGHAQALLKRVEEPSYAFQVRDGALYEGELLLSEWDDGEFVPSRKLLEMPSSYQQQADAYARTNGPS